MRVRVNFGARSFLYAEGSKHRVAADMWSDSLEDLREGFNALPFALEPDKEDVKDGNTLSKVSKASPPKPAPLTIPKDAGRGLWIVDAIVMLFQRSDKLKVCHLTITLPHFEENYPK